MRKLSGKVALVTGGNSGIGLATAKQFVLEGAYVFISGRREGELAKAAQEIGENVTSVLGDVQHASALDRALRTMLPIGLPPPGTELPFLDGSSPAPVVSHLATCSVRL